MKFSSDGFQSIVRKLNHSRYVAGVYPRSRVVVVGRWSVLGVRGGSTLHEIIAKGVSAYLYTLSGRAQFPILRASSFGVPHGRDISSCMFTMRSRRGLWNLPVLVRCALAVPSQVL